MILFLLFVIALPVLIVLAGALCTFVASLPMLACIAFVAIAEKLTPTKAAQ